MSRPLRRIALIYDARSAYDLKVMRGVARHLQRERKYSVYIEENALKDQRLPDLRKWKGDGIIADLDDPRVAKAVTGSGLAVVGFGGGREWAGSRPIPYFHTNNEAIAELVADHFFERGLRHFAYCGYPQSPINGWAAERERAFVRQVENRGACAVFRGRQRDRRDWITTQRSLANWIRTLPRPVGIMAANDERGRQLLEACRSAEIDVPDDVAVAGVDNDELLCELSSPPLTSVEQGAVQLGQDAAALLDEMIEGRTIARRHFVVNPISIVTRQSTDVRMVEDASVAAALAFIRDHACDGIRVPDVVRASATSRSALEIRFKTATGRTLRTAIDRVQLERARQLIAETDLPLKQVCARTGFRSIQHMTTRFGQRFGCTPGRYRRRGPT